MTHLLVSFPSFSFLSSGFLFPLPLVFSSRTSCDEESFPSSRLWEKNLNGTGLSGPWEAIQHFPPPPDQSWQLQADSRASSSSRSWQRSPRSLHGNSHLDSFQHDSQNHLFGQDSNYDLFNHTPGFNGQALEQAYTAFDETQLPIGFLDWHAQFNAADSEWHLSCLPEYREPPFFLSNTDFDSSTCPNDIPATSLPEEHHTVTSISTPIPESTPTESRSRSSPEDSKFKPVSSTESSVRIEKRTANTLAARRYRQKRLEQVSELEAALKEARLERDAFKNQVLKLQGETELLKELLRQKS
jgi:hypothetical protein